MEWQTPAVSEKFQSRFGRRPGTADSGDTGLGTSASDSTEGDHFCLNVLFFMMKFQFMFSHKGGKLFCQITDHTRTGLCYTKPNFQNISPCYHSMLLRIKSQWRWCVWERDLFFMPTRDGKSNSHAQQDPATNNRQENYFYFSILGPYFQYNTPVGKY